MKILYTKDTYPIAHKEFTYYQYYATYSISGSALYDVYVYFDAEPYFAISWSKDMDDTLYYRGKQITEEIQLLIDGDTTISYLSYPAIVAILAYIDLFYQMLTDHVVSCEDIPDADHATIAVNYNNQRIKRKIEAR